MGFFSGIASSLVGGAIGLFTGDKDRDTSVSSAREQMAFQERMYDSRYQKQMKDMQRAGLNPILSYKQGAPGGPAGAGYSSDFSGAVSKGVSSALAARRLNAELKQVEATIDNINADTNLKHEQQVVATSQHQLNDILGRQNVMRNLMLEPEAFSAEQLMRLIRAGGVAGETAAWINRLRRMLGIGGGS